MSGHSKWSQIKRQKGKTDAARGQLFTKVAREIIVAVREGGGDPAGNFKLRSAISRAKAMLVPNDNIDRAIQKGLGNPDGNALESVQYEGYGPGGVAVLIETLTDNRNRTAGDIRSYFNKCDGNLGKTGCVSRMFSKKGLTVVRAVDDLDALYNAVIEAGAEDIREQEDLFEVISEPDSLEAVSNAVSQSKFELVSSEVSYLPIETTLVSEPDIAKKLLKLLDLIEEQDDVQNVYANFELDEALAGMIDS